MECRYWTFLWDGTIWGTLFWMLFHVGHLRTPTVEPVARYNCCLLFLVAGAHSALRPGEEEVRALVSILSPTPTPCPGTTGLEPVLGSWPLPSTLSHKTSMRGRMNELGRFRELHTEHSLVLHTGWRTVHPSETGPVHGK